MIEDLLFIAKNLLMISSLDLTKFTEEEREYILNVVRKIIVVLLIELAKKTNDLK